MQFIDDVSKTGKIPAFDLRDEFDFGLYDYTKPSGRFLKSSKSRKVMEILDDIYTNHDTSWYTELRLRANRNMDALALFYRGNKISFRELFDKSDKLANSFVKVGIKPGDEIPCCISNMTELVYTMVAANKIGAKLNLFGTHLDKDYLESILNITTNKLFIASDDIYGDIKDTIEKIGFDHKLLYSLADSLLEDPTVSEEYKADLDRYYHYDNLAKSIYKNQDDSIFTFDEFIDYGKDFHVEANPNANLDTEFLITYTSGSTKKGFPKQIIHSNRSLIISGFFNDLEISGSPRIPYQRGMCYIHSESNTNLVTCISDSLMKLWSVACEPEYDRYKALDVIRLNNPSMIEMTTTHLIQMAKDYIKEYDNGKKILFPNLIATFAVGEAVTPGEEKLINKVLRKSKAGSEVVVKGITLPHAPLSVGGGDCEHGGIFYNVFNSIKSKKNYILTGDKDTGMSPVVFGIVTAVKETEKGKYKECNYNEFGILVANSATNMVGYKNDITNTIKKIIRDENGRDWLSCGCYGYIDKAGNVHQKDRIGSELILENGMMILPSMISKSVLKDTKNILSCTITPYHTETGDIPIVNFELSPLRISNRKKTILSMNERIKKELGEILGENIIYREFSDEHPFPEAGSGKRDILSIENMGLENAYQIKNNKRVSPKSKVNDVKVLRK